MSATKRAIIITILIFMIPLVMFSCVKSCKETQILRENAQEAADGYHPYY